jgi:hypothetical protein
MAPYLSYDESIKLVMDLKTNLATNDLSIHYSVNLRWQIPFCEKTWRLGNREFGVQWQLDVQW